MTREEVSVVRKDKLQFEILHNGPREEKARKVEVRKVEAKVMANLTATSEVCLPDFKEGIVERTTANLFASHTTFRDAQNRSQEALATKVCVFAQAVNLQSIRSQTARRRTD